MYVYICLPFRRRENEEDEEAGTEEEGEREGEGEKEEILAPPTYTRFLLLFINTPCPR